MRILVTGGAGFIGSHLCDRLVKDGHEVICLDNYFTGSKKNIAHLLHYDNFELIRHDVTIPYQIEADQIYNLACPASPVQYQKDPIKTIHTSVLGAINALELALKTGAKVLQASTSEVYGDPLEHPQEEKYWGNVNPIGFRSCYDEGKRCAETLFMDYRRQRNVNISIVRIFNTYGPNMALNDGRVVSNFIVQALNNKDISIYGDGKQTRSFQYVDDLIEGLLFVMESGITVPINIGNPKECSVIELAEIIIGLIKSNSKIVFENLPQDDPVRRQPDISFAKTIGWCPKVTLEEGLLKTIDYFRMILNKKYYILVENPFKDDTM
jgi:UDP-glucuronate decarboxylase